VTTKTYRNSREAAAVIMDGIAIGWHREGKTAVRKTADGRFAVIATIGDRLIKTFDNCLHARRYNFAIHGDKLGE
jgi:hypothetical protein